MPVEEIKAKRWTCGGCGRSVITADDEKPEGYHGNMELVTRKGEQGGEVYACKRGCIQKAVRAAVGDGSQADDEDDEVAPGFQRPNLPGNGPAV
jgi:hypothetical protein